MIPSMTGYGRVVASAGGHKYIVEVKSLNHRYLEVAVRLPGSLAALEMEIRKRIGERISRGRIEAAVRVCDDDCRESAGRIRLNMPLARNYHELLGQLRDELHIGEDIGLGALIGFKDIFVPADVTEDTAATAQGAMQAVEDALAVLVEMKQREGEVLCADMLARLESARVMVEGIAARSPAVLREYRERLRERLAELLAEVGLDEARFAQEIAYMAEKSDITEEIVRLRSHIEQFAQMLRSDSAAGRKVDFLIQEMNREINTIGAKSGDRKIADAVIEMKSELAKLREQAQNLE
jgi:uncharacterized protein (TIGR00255 family)